MKTLLLPLAAALAIVVAPASNAPASAGAAKAVLGAHPTQMTDISAARRHRYARHHYARPRVYAAPARDWSGVNAGNRPDSLLSFYRRNNICAIDEGYGRATRCD